MSNMDQCTMAFAGLCQAVKLIQEIARDGDTNSTHLHNTLQAILVTNPEDAVEVYGSVQNLTLGYKVLINQLTDQQQKDTELMRYIFGIIMLERKLSRKNQVLSNLASRIDQVHRQLQHFQITDPQVLANLASIYSDIISPLGPRVMISGRQNYIQNNLNQNKIRALLLSTMRSAVLWRQLGGKRRQLIFRKNEMISHAKKRLTECL